eukprot:16615-Heterococcus_DN1.PRE.3
MYVAVAEGVLEAVPSIASYACEVPLSHTASTTIITESKVSVMYIKELCRVAGHLGAETDSSSTTQTLTKPASSSVTRHVMLARHVTRFARVHKTH